MKNKNIKFELHCLSCFPRACVCHKSLSIFLNSKMRYKPCPTYARVRETLERGKVMSKYLSAWR